MKGVTLAASFDAYAKAHRHPMNQLCHRLGIPLVLVSLPSFFFAWKVALALFLVGLGFQLAGHVVFEKNRPSSLESPRYLLIGPLFLARELHQRPGTRQRNPYPRSPR